MGEIRVYTNFENGGFIFAAEEQEMNNYLILDEDPEGEIHTNCLIHSRIYEQLKYCHI